MYSNRNRLETSLVQTRIDGAVAEITVVAARIAAGIAIGIIVVVTRIAARMVGSVTVAVGTIAKMMGGSSWESSSSSYSS
jgi:hypothetical protein